MAKIDWHFRRPELAQSYLEKVLDAGINRIAFFGRRRIGKTEFMLRDLLPMALDRGALALYCSMWEDKERPYLAVISMLDDAKLPGKEIKQKLVAKASLPDQVEVGVEYERAVNPVMASANELQQVVSGFKDIVKRCRNEKRDCLVVIDEIQHLATSERFATFAATLRSALDVSGSDIGVLFTGSSRADLQKCFEDTRAPFFGFANMVDFQPMSHDYIDHLEETYFKITGKSLRQGYLGGIFEEAGRNAQIVRSLVERMIITASDDILDEWKSMKDGMQCDGGWCQKQWNSIHDSDRVIYKMVLDGKDIFSEDALASYDFSRGVAQQALARLQNKGFVSKMGHGQYSTEMPILDEWVRKMAT